jgi:hypothetical protein
LEYWKPVIAYTIILYKSTTKGETAKAFNELAKAIALLSFNPLGITIFGINFIGELNYGHRNSL